MFSIDTSSTFRIVVVLTTLLTGACAYERSPRQVDASNPTVSYKYRSDDDLIQANQMAAEFCSRYRSTPQPAQFATDRDGDRVVVFECVATRGSDATQGHAHRDYDHGHGSYDRDMTYRYRTDDELMDASREAQVICMNTGYATMSSRIVDNHDGTRTVTFQCRKA